MMSNFPNPKVASPHLTHTPYIGQREDDRQKKKRKKNNAMVRMRIGGSLKAALLGLVTMQTFVNVCENYHMVGAKHNPQPLVCLMSPSTKESVKTRPDTRLPKSRGGGQGPYLRPLYHLGRSSKAIEPKNQKKVKCDGRTDRRTDRQSGL